MDGNHSGKLGFCVSAWVPERVTLRPWEKGIFKQPYLPHVWVTWDDSGGHGSPGFTSVDFQQQVLRFPSIYFAPCLYLDKALSHKLACFYDWQIRWSDMFWFTNGSNKSLYEMHSSIFVLVCMPVLLFSLIAWVNWQSFVFILSVSVKIIVWRFGIPSIRKPYL